MSEVRTLIDGFMLGESPRWHGGRLWFGEFPRACSVAWRGGLRMERPLEMLGQMVSA